MKDPGPPNLEAERIRQEISNSLRVVFNPQIHGNETEIRQQLKRDRLLKFLINPDFSLEITADLDHGHWRLAQYRQGHHEGDALMGNIKQSPEDNSFQWEFSKTDQSPEVFGFKKRALSSEEFYEILGACIIEKLKDYFPPATDQ